MKKFILQKIHLNLKNYLFLSHPILSNMHLKAFNFFLKTNQMKFSDFTRNNNFQIEEDSPNDQNNNFLHNQMEKKEFSKETHHSEGNNNNNDFNNRKPLNKRPILRRPSDDNNNKRDFHENDNQNSYNTNNNYKFSKNYNNDSGNRQYSENRSSQMNPNYRNERKYSPINMAPRSYDNYNSSYRKVDVAPKTNWGNRYKRNNTLNPRHWAIGRKLIKDHKIKLSEISEDQKTLLYSDEITKNLQIYYQGKLVNENKELVKEDINNFDLKKLMIENIKQLDIVKLAPIQQKVIPIMLKKFDLIGVAQTGSGKTLAFLIPIVNDLIHFGPPELNEEPINEEGKSGNNQLSLLHINRSISYPLAVILAPTRELANQIFDECLKITHETGIQSLCIYGGGGMYEQINALRDGVDIIVATPGRLNDLLGKGLISLSKVKTVVLDEADRMLDMGFEPQINEILKKYDMPSKDKRQNVMFSATFDKEIVNIAKNFLNDFYYIGNPFSNFTVNKNIEQKLILTDKLSKFPKLLEMLREKRSEHNEKTIIFVNTKADCSFLEGDLRDNGFNCVSVHGDKEQRDRQFAINDFKKPDTNILIATDVASRGIDFHNIGMVVNYELPKDVDSYIHRIGRTGRKGLPGTSVTFVHGNDNHYVLNKIFTIINDLNQPLPDWASNFDNKSHQSHHNNRNRNASHSNFINKRPFNQNTRRFDNENDEDRSFNNNSRTRSSGIGGTRRVSRFQKDDE